MESWRSDFAGGHKRSPSPSDRWPEKEDQTDPPGGYVVWRRNSRAQRSAAASWHRSGRKTGLLLLKVYVWLIWKWKKWTVNCIVFQILTVVTYMNEFTNRGKFSGVFSALGALNFTNVIGHSFFRFNEARFQGTVDQISLEADLKPGLHHIQEHQHHHHHHILASCLRQFQVTFNSDVVCRTSRLETGKGSSMTSSFKLGFSFAGCSGQWVNEMFCAFSGSYTAAAKYVGYTWWRCRSLGRTEAAPNGWPIVQSAEDKILPTGSFQSFKIPRFFRVGVKSEHAHVKMYAALNLATSFVAKLFGRWIAPEARRRS